MKKTLFLASILVCCLTSAYGETTFDNSTTTGNTYTTLDGAFCNETNKVTYDGLGTFSVLSSPTTEIDVTISISALDRYLASNDYTTSGFVTWTYNVTQSPTSWGLNDTATGIIGSWNGGTNGTETTYETLKQYAVGDTLTLTITNDPKKDSTVNDGIYVYAGETQVWGSGNLFNSYATQTTAYTVNTNYVTAVTIKTASTLDTSTFEPPVILDPFVSTRTDGTSVGRVMCVGDSITHGIKDATWRWQLFKTLVDNGIEHELEGPLKGFDNRSQYAFSNDEGITHNSQTITYGNGEFNNVHLAQSSGRAHELVNDSNSRYSGFSTEDAARQYNANTYIMMIGTNDLLSDTNNNIGWQAITPEQYTTYMQKLLGGEVSYEESTDSYSWNGTLGGNMLTAVNDLLVEDSDKLYLMNIPCWTDHANNTAAKNHHAVEEYNRLLVQWVDAYNEQYSTGTGEAQVKLVNVNNGLIDLTDDTPFKGHRNFFNAPGSDGLHPNEQGSLIIAGNLSKAMGIGGRTAGLARADKNTADTTWHSASVGINGTVRQTAIYRLAENAFTEDAGYTVDFRAAFGNGATDGWLGADNTLSISIGDGANSGTLNLSEGYIMWGTDVLFCADTSALDENLRIAWHNGNSTDNVLGGYYVWLGDMLIGQGLAADATGSGLNGIAFTATGARGNITDLSWSNTAYAPTTTLTTSTEYAYQTQQDAGTAEVIQNTYPWNNDTESITTSGVNYGNTTPTTITIDSTLVTSDQSASTHIITTADPTTETEAWVGMVNCEYESDIHVQHTGNIYATIFGSMNAGNAGKLVLDIEAGSTIGSSGTYNGVKAAIAGSYGGGDAEEFNVYINGGSIGGDVVGGSVNNSGSIGEVNLVINDGTIDASIYGGSKVSEGNVGKAAITINGGVITGHLVAEGSAGSIGDVNVTINGGIICGNIAKGNGTQKEGSTTSVTIVGNKAFIGGNIEADTVTLRDVSESGAANGFDKYANTITSQKMVLDNVQTELVASVSVEELSLTNGTNTSIVMGDTRVLESLTLDANTTFGAFKAADARTVETGSETTLTLTTLTVGKGATLNANIVLGADSTLSLEGCLTMGSTVSLTSGMTIDLSEDMLALMYDGKAIDLFTSVDSLTLDGNIINPDTVTNVNFTVDDKLQNFNMGYSNEGGTVSITLVPEPTTATLSLLALAALAARRRRK
ncbi:MAG: hypothetical protein IJB31_05765 [Akkermansia sp.]|nr:hypothetical protein [Akkermansia sp.]